MQICIQFLHTVKPLYTDIQYNNKIRYNNNLNAQKEADN